MALAALFPVFLVAASACADDAADGPALAASRGAAAVPVPQAPTAAPAPLLLPVLDAPRPAAVGAPLIAPVQAAEIVAPVAAAPAPARVGAAELAANDAEAWAAVFRALREIPEPEPRFVKSRRLEQLVLLRRMVRGEGTNPQTLANAREVLRSLEN